MGIDKLLEKKFSAIKEDNFLDITVFDLSTEIKPEYIYIRPELESVIEPLANYLTLGVPEHLLILGGRGTGKTTSIILLVKELKKFTSRENVKTQPLDKYFYINARESSTQREIFEKIIGKSIRGSAFGEVLKELDEKLSGRTILIIDEVDFLQSNEIFYHITRSTKVFIIAIAQSINWFRSLDSGIQSSFRPTMIFFKDYDATQLKEILTLRAKAGLKHYDESGIALISALVAHDYRGDARIGIRALYHAGKQDKWDHETIKKCVEQAAKEIEMYTMNSLSLRDLVILSALTEQNNTNEAYDIALNRLKMFSYPLLSKATYFKTLNYLQNLGLITLIKKRAGRYYTYEAQLLIPPNIIIEELKKRISLT
jgi:cell division control protein 6